MVTWDAENVKLAEFMIFADFSKKVQKVRKVLKSAKISIF